MKRTYGLAVALLLASPPDKGWAKPTMGQSIVEDRWEELRAKYPDQGCVIVNKDTEVVLRFSDDQLVTEIRKELILAVFDLSKAPHCLEHSFDIFPGEVAKDIRVWSRPHGSEQVTWAKKGDVTVVNVFSDWRQVRIAIPGLSQSGSCGIVLRTETRGAPPLIEHFATEYPIENGEFRLSLPPTGYSVQKTTEFFDRYFQTIEKGNLKHVDPYVTQDKGFTRAYRVSEVPALPKGPLVRAEDLPEADLYIVSRIFSWRETMKDFYLELGKLPAPKQLLRAAKDTLDKASDQQRVLALSRYLDDPDNFRLIGSPRSFLVARPNLEQAVQDKGGDSFVKTLLAYRLLRELGTTCYLVLGCSQYLAKPDWRVFDPEFLNAYLIWVPGAGGDFIWDVADRSVTIGWAGADLYPGMLVVSENSDIQQFPLSVQRSAQKRLIEWNLEKDGSLNGTLTWSFEGWPDPDMDPWQNEGADWTSLIEKGCPQGVRVRKASWSSVDVSGMRCSSAAPAVLVADLEAEAEPTGEAGWALVPFQWPAPSYLSWAISSTKNAPIYLDRPRSVEDSIVVTLPEGFMPGSLPEALQGYVTASWHREGNKIFATRVMSLPKLQVEAASVHDLSKILDAWNACANQKVAVGQ